MIRFLNLFFVITSAMLLVGVYALKYQTVDTANEKLALERTIEQQENGLSSLRADWAYLNQPSRINPIIQRHLERLELQIVSQDQFISIDEIPMRVAKPDDDALTELFKSLEAGVDPIAVLIEASQ